MHVEQVAEQIRKEMPAEDWHKAKVYFAGNLEELIRRVIQIDRQKHICSFGFGNGRFYSREKSDWVCSCGKTRREDLKEMKENDE